MQLDDAALERLEAIVAPFDATRIGLSITIEDVDGRRIAGTTPSVARTASGGAWHEIIAAGKVVGRVVGRGTGEPALIEAIVASVAASVAGVVEATAVRAGVAELLGPDAESIRLHAELTLARRIQRSFVSLIPPDVRGYEVAGHYEAAREVGGDFFDVFPIRNRAGRIAICVADVTGKGIAAALLMAFARPLLHAAVDHSATPGEALERTNRVLVEERHSSLFITALCAVVELRAGIVHLANAGHEPPLLVPAGDGPITWLEASGPLLGTFRRLDLVECSIQLAPGDLVLFYTDGVTDAQAENGERFGDQRLVDAITAARGGSAAEVVASVCDAYHAFQGDMPAADDVTIVAIRRSPRRR
jgi:serine phosphatase RsbU (regulator of sigma subunit)